MPFDTSAEHLQAAAGRIAKDYPALGVEPVVADFTLPIAVPERLKTRPRALFFPGSTIGNFTVLETQALPGRLGRLPNVVALVVGIDPRKDMKILVSAYDDAAGVTAAFNKNLARMNQELGATFELSALGHEARWKAAQSRIEMHLVSKRPRAVRIASRRFDFDLREKIHTENSHKFSVKAFQALAGDAGWASADVWLDPERLFGVHLLVPTRTSERKPGTHAFRNQRNVSLRGLGFH